MPVPFAMRLRVAELLAQRELTAYKLAALSGGRISQSAAYRLAEPSGAFRCLRADVMDALCEVLQVPPGELFHAPPRRRR